LKKSELLKGDLKIELNLPGDIKVSGKVVISQAQDVPLQVIKEAEIKYVNRRIFDLIQQIQSQKGEVNRRAAFEALKQID